MPIRAGRFAALTVWLTLCLAACTSGESDPARTSVSAAGSAARPPTGVSGLPSSAGTSTSPAGPAQAVFAAMSLRQRVGQLLMVDCPSSGVADATVSAIGKYDVGSVILDGTTTSGSAAIRALTSRLQRYAPKRTGLLIATDQEGGIVQRLQGPGFSAVPAATQQGTVAPSVLRSDARTWGSQLKEAGVDVDLAPVLDTVPSAGQGNPPIGDLDREYGHTPSVVRSHGLAVAQGLMDAGVAPTVKHFPGLGRVSGNTDVTSGVTDFVTTRTDAYLAPFRAAASAGVPFVMMSTAIYSRIDPDTPAAFSRTIVSGMLRGDLGYRGVIISDDLGASRQVGYLSPGQRAVQFVRAGGDIVLTVVADQAETMTSALVAEADSSPAFHRQIDAAALRVLQAKQRAGLL